VFRGRYLFSDEFNIPEKPDLQALFNCTTLCAAKQSLSFRPFTPNGSDGLGKVFMSRGILRICFLAGCFLPASFAATAQEVIHALIGTIGSINSAAKTIVVKTDDGVEANLKDMVNSHRKIAFDKSARADAAAAGDFSRSGEHVIVYYFGFGDLRTVVAMRSLGPGPFAKTVGTVVSFNKKEHSLTMTDQSGEAQLFEVAPDSVADTELGAVGGLDFRPAKGDPVQVTFAVVNGNRTALFIGTVPPE